MFTGIITDVGTVRSAEQRGDLRLTIGCGYDLDTRRPRRLDRLLGRLPDGGRQGRRLVRGRRLGRNRLAHRAGPVARGRAAQPRARAAPRRRARRPYRHRPCRRRRRRSIGVCPEGDSTRIGIACPRDLGADDRAQGLDHARRRVADRQRGRATRTTARPISRSTSSPTPPQHTTLGRASRPGDSSMSRSTCLRAILSGCWPLAHSRNTSVPAFHHIAM